MIVWLNGTFGVGKTTTANALREQTDWRFFDPEHVGYVLAGNLRDLDFEDFQDLPPWRALVPAFIDEIARFTAAEVLVAVQTVLVEDYWRELRAGLAERELPVTLVLLDCEMDELRRRIDTDEEEADARQWRLDHLERFAEARGWMRAAADLVVDTTGRSAEEVARAIIAAR